MDERTSEQGDCEDRVIEDIVTEEPPPSVTQKNFVHLLLCLLFTLSTAKLPHV